MVQMVVELDFCSLKHYYYSLLDGDASPLQDTQHKVTKTIATHPHPPPPPISIKSSEPRCAGQTWSITKKIYLF